MLSAWSGQRVIMREHVLGCLGSGEYGLKREVVRSVGILIQLNVFICVVKTSFGPRQSSNQNLAHEQHKCGFSVDGSNRGESE